MEGFGDGGENSQRVLRTRWRRRIGIFDLSLWNILRRRYNTHKYIIRLIYYILLYYTVLKR